MSSVHETVETDAERAPASSPGWWQRLLRGARRLYARTDWVDLLGDDWAERIMQARITDDLHEKQGRSTCRWALDARGRQLVVYLKRHFQLPRRHGLLAAFFPGADWSPGMQECRNLEWAKAQGLPVPEIAAAGEFLGPWGKLQSFLAVEELTDMLPLHEAIPRAAQELAPPIFRIWKVGLVREIARLTRALHERDHFHKDLYLCHFFIRRADITTVPTWTDRVFMIDFHRLARHSFTRSFWLSKDIGQLLYSSQVDGIDSRDRLRFWHAYLGSQRRTWWGRWMRRIVQMRGRNYSKHNAKDAARKSALV